MPKYLRVAIALTKGYIYGLNATYSYVLYLLHLIEPMG